MFMKVGDVGYSKVMEIDSIVLKTELGYRVFVPEKNQTADVPLIWEEDVKVIKNPKELKGIKVVYEGETDEGTPITIIMSPQGKFKMLNKRGWLEMKVWESDLIGLPE
jgi:hypothetical protein